MNIATRLSSSAFSKSVPASTSDLIGGSTRPSMCWRGKSYVAAAQEPSDFAKKIIKRVPQKERKAMVECYVNKYRAVNSGKFPTPKEAMRQLGGGYYLIRKIIQELQYQAKTSSLSTVKTQGEAMKDGKRVSPAQHLSTSNMTINKNIYHDGHTSEARDCNLSSLEEGKLSSIELPSVVKVQEESTTQIDAQALPETESANNYESLHEVKEVKLFQSESDKKIAGNSFEFGVGSDFLKPTKNDESLHEVKKIQFFQSESNVTIANKSCDSAAGNICSDPPKATNAQFINTTSSEKMETPSSTGDTTQVENVIDDKLKVETADFQQYFHNSKDNAKVPDMELDKLKPEPEPGQLQQTQKLGTVTRDLPKRHVDEAEVAKKSNMWGDLKSFAGGLFSFFKKQ